MTLSVNNLGGILRRYIFVRWKAMVLAAGASVAVTLLNIVALALFAAVPHLILSTFKDRAEGLVPETASGDKVTTIAEIVNRIGVIVDQYYVEHGVVTILLVISAAYLATSILIRLVQLFSEYLVLISRSQAGVHMMKDVFRHLTSLSLDFFYRHRVGDLVVRVRNDTSGLADVAFEIVNTVVMALPLFVFYWVVLISTSWQLTATAVAVYAVKVLISDRFARRIKPIVTRLSSDLGRTAAKLTEVFSNISVVKAYHAEVHELLSFGSKLETHYKYHIRRRFTERLDHAVQTILLSIAIVAVAVVGLLLLLEDSIELVTLTVFLFAANRTQEPTRKIISTIMVVQQARGVAVRVLEIMRERPSVIDGTDEAPEFESTFVFEDVSFGYRPSGPVVSNISLTVRKNEVVAIVGSSGAGKSTLLNLLLRFCDPQEGRILFDGQNIRDFQHASYLRLFGVVTQEPLLFNASVHDNIAYAGVSNQASRDDMLQAARIAHVDEFAEHLPEGYDTFIGDRGVKLSGGQKQRIALARAIIRNPSIMILDEATSSLDSHSERLIQDAVERFLKGRTAVIVAHRLSTIRRADRIILLDKGQIVEVGTHQQLLAKRSSYYNLYQSEISRGADPHAFESGDN